MVVCCKEGKNSFVNCFSDSFSFINYRRFSLKISPIDKRKIRCRNKLLSHLDKRKQSKTREQHKIISILANLPRFMKTARGVLCVWTWQATNQSSCDCNYCWNSLSSSLSGALFSLSTNLCGENRIELRFGLDRDKRTKNERKKINLLATSKSAEI